MSKFIKGKVSKRDNLVKVIKEKYEDGLSFPYDEEIIANNPVNMDTNEFEEIGGLNVADETSVLRWLLRGDTICDCIIPEGTDLYEFYTTQTNGGSYRANKIILTNPRKLTDEIVYDYYLSSNLPWHSYIKALAYISACNFRKTALKIVEDKVTKENAKEALETYDGFLQRRSNPMPDVYIEVYNLIDFLIEKEKLSTR